MRNERANGQRLLFIIAAGILTTTAGLAPSLAQQTVGLFLDTPAAFEGYTLWNPRFETSYLINNEGKVVHTWSSAFQPGNTSYLLPTGNLVRTAKDGPAVPIRFTPGGFGGRVEEIAWDGTVIWSYLYSDDFKRLHHDIEPLPNGNVLMIAWELKTGPEAIQAGCTCLRLPERSGPTSSSGRHSTLSLRRTRKKSDPRAP